jgi:hypothetical protein
MTPQQIQWASLHDWFLRPSRDGKGVVVLDNYTKGGMEVSETLTFCNFQQLRDWAGY